MSTLLLARCFLFGRNPQHEDQKCSIDVPDATLIIVFFLPGCRTEAVSERRSLTRLPIERVLCPSTPSRRSALFSSSRRSQHVMVGSARGLLLVSHNYETVDGNAANGATGSIFSFEEGVDAGGAELSVFAG